MMKNRVDTDSKFGKNKREKERLDEEVYKEA